MVESKAMQPNKLMGLVDFSVEPGAREMDEHILIGWLDQQQRQHPYPHLSSAIPLFLNSKTSEWKVIFPWNEGGKVKTDQKVCSQ